jgi:phosphatidate cytidylyltransferase
VTGAVLIALVLLALFLLRPWAWGIAVLAVIGAGAREWAALLAFSRARTWTFVAVVVLLGGTALLAATPTGGEGWPRPIVLYACGIATFFWLFIGTTAVLFDWQPRHPSASAIGGVVVLLGAFVAVVELQARSPWLVLAAMAIVWIADSAAFFAGRKFGRHKLAPHISPGKSWEGAAGGVIAVVIYAALLVPLARRAGFTSTLDAPAIATWLAFVVALTALSIIGDLHESLLKRRAGVKDSGSLLPGHGGVLDRTDALLAAMPPFALAARLFMDRI